MTRQFLEQFTVITLNKVVYFLKIYISTYIQDILADFFLKKRIIGSALK